MFELNNFDSIQIGIASPEKIRQWSHGEVTKPETINYRSQKPEKDGLFCEKIFGPTKDYECSCGKYKRVRFKGVVCDKCGVEVTKSNVRRERMGHIDLATSVTHIWYFKGMPSRISMLLDMSAKDLEQVVYYVNHIVIDPGNTNLQKKQILSEKEFREAQDTFGPKAFKAGMGADALKELLQEINLEEQSKELKAILETATGQKRVNTIKKLEVVEAFRKSNNKPEWMILDAIPVLPPEIRPMVQLDGGRYAASDLNDLYRRIINRNNRLKKMIEMNSPEIILRNEKRMVQEAVDALIDNGKRGKPSTGSSGKELKSLSAMLKGKQGRFRQNLLGKRVDYSGRSVIVVGPTLKLYQCGLPKEMALELFKPFVMRQLVEKGISTNIKTAKKDVERAKTEVWDILEDVIKDHPVLLNRAPTLHRLGIQAFEPILVEGKALKLHPLVCSAFNADFDGDQMAVHVPLSIEAQTEARFLMLSTNNILKLSDGKPILSPTQDMVIGSYYLTIEKPDAKGTGKIFMSADEAKMAYANKEIELQSKIFVRVTKEIDGQKYSKRLHTTVGRIIFNESIPQNLGFIKRENPEDQLDLEVDSLVDKKMLSKIVDACYATCGATATCVVLDNIKALGFKYSTIGAVTASVFDMHIPKEKKSIIAASEKEISKIEAYYEEGLLTEEERYKKVIATWEKASDDITNALKGTLETFNPVWMMANSGARGSMNQIRQLSGWRGLMADPSGKTIELPVKSSFREGLSVLDYFISSHGGRKGLADTALKTANSGYLTRRLVDVAQEVIVREEDCGDTKGILTGALLDAKGSVIETISARIVGRYAIENVIDPNTGEVIIEANTMITNAQAKQVETAGIENILIRSVLTCNTKNGVCTKCYGANMATTKPVKIGEVVGTIAAQSIGEPGTQLTMRTFHTGGVATSEDITLGLPRVEELFEARKPKGQAIIAENTGSVLVKDEQKRREVVVIDSDGIETSYAIPYASKIIVTNGTMVEPGTPLTSGSINPADILKTRGAKGVQDYLIREVQNAYHSNGVDIADKHIEVIVRQMLKKVRVENSGTTEMLPGELVDISIYDEENRKALENGGRPATAKRTLLGITKASLATNSWLSAASFQETARVLTDGAIKNKVDHLIGLKENIIIGKLIPAGTGMKQYRKVRTEDTDSAIRNNFIPQAIEEDTDIID